MQQRIDLKVTEVSTLLAYGLTGGVVGYLILHPVFQLVQNPSLISNFGSFIANVFSTNLLFEAYYFMIISFLAGITLGYLNFQNYKINQLILVDELTTLFNRRYFNQRLSEEVERSIRYKDPLSILVIDLDHFKHYNDHNGHSAGDYLLQELCTLMKKTFRKTDILCRYGGEEFVAIIPETNKTEAKVLAETFRKRVQDYPFKFRTTQPKRKVTISVGIADIPNHADTPKELLEKADDALYQAKETGRNKTVVASLRIR